MGVFVSVWWGENKRERMLAEKKIRGCFYSEQRFMLTAQELSLLCCIDGEGI